MMQGDPKGITEWTLVTVDYRVPRMNELYINKLGRVQRCKAVNYSNRAQPRVIVAEKWQLIMGLASSYQPPKESVR